MKQQALPTSVSPAPATPSAGPAAAAPTVQPWGNAAAATEIAQGGFGAQIQQGLGGVLRQAQDLAGQGQRAVHGAAQTLGEVGQRAMGRGTGDIRREGTFTDPASGRPVTVGRAKAEASAQRERLGDHLMDRYAFQPSGRRTTPPGDDTLRLFSPGLNTPEPEASRRTQYYANQLGQPMVHLHNGSNADAKMPGAANLDYATFAATRLPMGRSTPLIDSMAQVLSAALTGAKPQDVHAILYSDSTVAGSRAIARVRQQMIASRLQNGMDAKRATAEVQQLLDRHLFVEMHGNVTDDLPAGPRYLMWADRKDDLTHKDLPGTDRTLGLHGKNRDRDANAVYVDYNGPYGGADAHNLAATGVHAVRATWAANGVDSSQELFERARANGGQLKPPGPIQGDPKRLWNPRNDPNYGKKASGSKP